MTVRRFAIACVVPLVALAGCNGKAPEPAPSAEASAAAALPTQGPTAAPGISLTDAEVRLPLASGAPGVAYFTLSQGAGAAHKLAAVDVTGAGRAEMHETKTAGGVSSMDPVKDVPIEAGKSVVFAPGGYHVMLFDLDPKLKAGGTTELTITLDNGDKATAKAAIRSGPAAMDHMGGM